MGVSGHPALDFILSERAGPAGVGRPADAVARDLAEGRERLFYTDDAAGGVRDSEFDDDRRDGQEGDSRVPQKADDGESPGYWRQHVHRHEIERSEGVSHRRQENRVI